MPMSEPADMDPEAFPWFVIGFLCSNKGNVRQSRFRPLVDSRRQCG